MNTNLVRQRTIYQVPDSKEKIQYYENGIPDFVTEEMNSCYGDLYSSIPYLRLAGKLSASTCTYIAYANGAIRSIFLFEREGELLKVLNGAIRTEPAEVGRFADYIFGRMPQIQRICFPGVHMKELQLPYPYQRFFSGEDIVISFEGTADEYAQQLGKNTRKSIKRHATALRKHHPDSCYRAVKGNLVSAALTATIVNWNRQRMSDKNKVSAYDEGEARRITALAALDGMVGTVVVDNRIHAGTVCCRVGDTCYLAIMGHDSDYNEFSLGMLCNYWTSLECLRMNCKEINLMGGRLPYKYSFLGEPRRYDCVVLYRNRGALFRNIRDAMRTTLHGYTTEAKLAILDCERKEGTAARMVVAAITAWRESRQAYHRIRKKVLLPIDCMWMAMAMQVAESVPLL
jgi:hypothetical protein